jgi:hypothetical protein
VLGTLVILLFIGQNYQMYQMRRRMEGLMRIEIGRPGEDFPRVGGVAEEGVAL